MQNMIELKNICYSYHSLHGETRALQDVSFGVREGEFVALVGPSGCGNGMCEKRKQTGGQPPICHTFPIPFHSCHREKYERSPHPRPPCPAAFSDTLFSLVR